MKTDETELHQSTPEAELTWHVRYWRDRAIAAEAEVEREKLLHAAAVGALSNRVEDLQQLVDDLGQQNYTLRASRKACYELLDEAIEEVAEWGAYASVVADLRARAAKAKHELL